MHKRARKSTEQSDRVNILRTYFWVCLIGCLVGGIIGTTTMAAADKREQDETELGEFDPDYDKPDEMGLQRRPFHSYWIMPSVGYSFADLTALSSNNLYPPDLNPQAWGAFGAIAAGVRFDRHYLLGIKAQGAGYQDFGMGQIMLYGSLRIRRLGIWEPYVEHGFGYAWTKASSFTSERTQATQVNGFAFMIGAGVDAFVEHWFSIGLGFDLVGTYLLRPGTPATQVTDSIDQALANPGSALGVQVRLELCRLGFHFL